MVALQEAQLRTEGGSLILSLTLDSAPAEPDPLQAQLALHDDVSIVWQASFSCTRNGEAWEGRLDWQPAEQSRLLQLARMDDAGGAPIDLRSDRLFLEPLGGGTWATGAIAEAERLRLEEAREARFGVPLVHPDAKPDDPVFAVVMLADNVLLSTVQRVPGLWLLPMSQTTLGVDIPEVLNMVLRQLGFGSGVDAGEWVEQVRRRRPAAALHAPKVRAGSAGAALDVSRETARRLLDLLALRRGASPRLLGGVIGVADGTGEVQSTTFWFEGAGYTGNLVAGLGSGGDQHGMLQLWEGLSADPRTRLWLSLHADAIADERWDYRLFRCFNLLEGIAAEVAPKGVRVLDDHGAPRMQDNGRPYTTDHARGKVHALLESVAGGRQQTGNAFAAPRADGTTPALWDEVGLWYAVRNAVAHRGSWELPQGATLTAHEAVTRASTEAEIATRGHDGTFRGGIWRTVRGIRTAVDLTLRAALRGQL